MARLTTSTEMHGAVADAQLVVEAATERLDLKLKIFEQIDAAASAGRHFGDQHFQHFHHAHCRSGPQRPDKVIGMHFMNPVPIMKLVEVIRGYDTSDETTALVVDLSRQLGKVPVEVNDYPGFVANRILMPMINEAICSLHEGVAGVAEIDEVMKLGHGPSHGPLHLADFHRFGCLFEHLRVLARRIWPAQVRALSLAGQHGHGGQAGGQIWRGLLRTPRGAKTSALSPAFS